MLGLLFSVPSRDRFSYFKVDVENVCLLVVTIVRYDVLCTVYAHYNILYHGIYRFDLWSAEESNVVGGKRHRRCA